MKKYLAELIGTFVLVLMGCGSAVIAGAHIGFLGIALTFGLSVLVMVYCIGPISGCHINSAITIAMLTAGKINLKDTIGYVVAQCLGAIIAAAVLLAIVSGRPEYSIGVSGLGQNGYGSYSPDHFSLAACFLAEVALTFIFLLVVFGSTHEAAPKGFAGLAIGLSLTMIHLVGIPITGTSVNPARSLGPALLVGGTALSQLWLFIIAPIIGGILAALLWRGAFEKRTLS
ncbi:Aquaporin Z [Candidatus Zixiibacteriota bacterium]|nr:Aquaporin Z [candidate division Zixibacteria bacterium]